MVNVFAPAVPVWIPRGVVRSGDLPAQNTSNIFRVPERGGMNRASAFIGQKTHKTDASRAIVLLNADEDGPNKFNDEIAAIADVGMATVSGVCKRYIKWGLNGFLPRHFAETKNKKRRMSFEKR